MRCVCALIVVTVVLMAADLRGVESKRMESMEEIKKAVKSLRKTCQQKTGASKEVLDGAVNGQFPPDKQLQCYLKCLMTLTKAMKNDKMQVEFLRKQADLMLPTQYIDRFKNAVDVCSQKVDGSEPDSCVLAWNAAKSLLPTVIPDYEDSPETEQKSSNQDYSKDHRHHKGNHSRHRAERNIVCKNSRTKRHCRRV